MIGHNEGRLGKNLFTSVGDGEKVSVRGLWDGKAEARWVGEEIETLQHRKWSLDQMAVLVRATFQMREFEGRFNELGIPHKIIGGRRFYEREEIRDALAYLRVTAQSHDDLALGRIINTPKRAIGDATLQILNTHARAKNISLYQAIIDLTQTDALKPKVKGALMKLVDDFERWRSLISTMHHAELAGLILDESGYMQMWRGDKSPDAPGRIENLKELMPAMEEHESLADFLEHIALVLENQNNNSGEQITLMTLHAAKGLEFDAVFLPGWEEGLFPSQRTMDENGVKGLEEERRLAYVGITRARKKSYISYVANRWMYNTTISAIPSRFVDELPEDHIDVTTDSGLYGPGRSQHWDSSGFSGSSFTRAREVPARAPAGDAKSESGFSRGERVFHSKFGHGTVISVEGKKLDIKFDEAGHMRLMDNFILKEAP